MAIYNNRNMQERGEAALKNNGNGKAQEIQVSSEQIEAILKLIQDVPRETAMQINFGASERLESVAADFKETARLVHELVFGQGGQSKGSEQTQKLLLRVFRNLSERIEGLENGEADPTQAEKKLENIRPEHNPLTVKGYEFKGVPVKRGSFAWASIPEEEREAALASVLKQLGSQGVDVANSSAGLRKEGFETLYTQYRKITGGSPGWKEWLEKWGL